MFGENIGGGVISPSRNLVGGFLMFMFPPLGIGRNFFVVRRWKLEGRAFPPLGIRRGDFFVGRGEFDKGDVSPLGIWGDFLWAGEI